MTIISSKNKKAVLTGIFVLVAIALLLVALFVVINKDKNFAKSILVKVVFDDVKGLAKGNNVWYEGVKIGTVKDLVFAKKGVEVSFSIEETVLSHLHMDTKAKLGSDGLIGNRIIVLYDGSTTSAPISAGHMFAVEKSTGPDEILNTLQKSNNNLLAITDNFKLISADLASGKGTIGKLLTDEALINTLQTTILTLQKAGLNAQSFTSNLAVFSSKLDSKGSVIHELVTDTSLYAALKATSLQLKNVSLHADEAAQNLVITSQTLKDTSGPVGVLLNDKATAENLRNTVKNLQSSSRKLDETMDALQHNFLVRGFFKKKAKEAARKKDSNTATVSEN